MTKYYIFTAVDDFETVFEELSHLPSESFVSIVVKDNGGILPSKYIQMSTEMFTDAGLVDFLKRNTSLITRRVKILKELQATTPLI